jgi:mannosyltransferase
MSQAEQKRAPFALLILVGAALRLTGLEVHSLWFDEAMTLYHAGAEDMSATLGADRHPPLSFLLFRYWRSLAGSSEAALRLLPAAASTGALVLFAVLARHWLDKRAALVAVALWAVSPFHIWFGQQVRGYAFLDATVLMAILGVVRPRRWLVFLGVALSVGLHWMGGLVVATVLALAALELRRGRLDRRGWLTLSGAALLGLAVWVPFLVRFLPDQMASNWGYTARLSARDFAELPVRLLLVELDVLAGGWQLAGWALGGLLVAGMLVASVRQRDALVCLLAPIAGAVLAMLLVPPSFIARYLIAAAPGAALLAGAGLVALRPRALGTAAATLAVLGCLGLSLLHKAGNRREDFRSAAAEVVERYEPGDGLFVATGVPAGFAESPLVYYLREHPDVLAALLTWDEARDFTGRLHVVQRRARYAEAEVGYLFNTRALEDESPERFRIRRLLFAAP